MTMTRAIMEIRIINVILKDLESTMEITSAMKERWPKIYQIVVDKGWQALPFTYVTILYYWMEKNNFI